MDFPFSTKLRRSTISHAWQRIQEPVRKQSLIWQRLRSSAKRLQTTGWFLLHSPQALQIISIIYSQSRCRVRSHTRRYPRFWAMMKTRTKTGILIIRKPTTIFGAIPRRTPLPESTKLSRDMEAPRESFLEQRSVRLPDRILIKR